LPGQFQCLTYLMQARSVVCQSVLTIWHVGVLAYPGLSAEAWHKSRRQLEQQKAWIPCTRHELKRELRACPWGNPLEM